MGFSNLRLVRSSGHSSRGARATGYASHDILDKTETFDNLLAAIEDLDLIIGTTAKKRLARHDYFEPKDLLPLLRKKGTTLSSVGIVFGSEENGLTKQELKSCDIISSVPMALTYPSLNLAQTVLIYAYELSELKLRPGPPKGQASSREHAELRKEGKDILKWLEADRKPSLYRRMLDRLNQAGEADVHLLLSLAKFLRQKKD